jgi:hypothetical protein
MQTLRYSGHALGDRGARGVKDVVERRAVVEERGLDDPWVGASVQVN